MGGCHPFKSWTVNRVVQHLHGSDVMAVMALKDEKVLDKHSPTWLK